MANKKKEYKPSTKYRSLKNEGMLVRGAFTMDSAKVYIALIIAAFHILPLCFVAFGETGKQLLTMYCMTIINPIIVFMIMLIYGVRIGFNFKMPLLCTVIAAVSIVMYYDFNTDVSEGILYYPLVAATIMFFVYGILAYVSNIIGAFIKHFLV